MSVDPFDGYRAWKRWDRLFDPTPNEIAMFRKQLSGTLLRGRRLLDIGFGSGALLAWARLEGAHVAGTELQTELCAAAKERGIRACTELAELDERFDVITIFDVLEHVPREQLPAMLDDVKRLAAPGCQIFVRVPNCQVAPGLLTQFGDATHVTMLSGPIVAHLLSRAGLLPVAIREAIDVEPPTGLLRSLLRPLQRLVRRFAKLMFRFVWSTGSTPLSINVLIVARAD